MHLVTVIVPNYNHSQYLKKRIDTILYQSYQDLEIIILDDCSTDNSKDIIEQYRICSKVSHIIYNKANSGSTFAQWNKGINLAAGKYIWVAESDDWCEHSFLEKMMNVFEADATLGLVYCQSWKVNEQDEIIGNMKEWTDYVDNEHWNHDFKSSGKQELQSYFYLRNTIPNASAVVFKKALFAPLSPQVLKMRLCGDKMVWTDLLSQTNIYFIADSLNYFRFHSNNVRSGIHSIQNLYENFVWFHYFSKRIPLSKEKSAQVKLWLMNWWQKVGRGNYQSKFFKRILLYAFKIDISFGFKVLNNLIATTKWKQWKRTV
ncbi:glycosyltransferase family 2 protein [Pontibacter russatus]|uniref:glycosyltransferase family 2 protein n=1 Tax=Pontibacter russatus TaxID=2694929 RepID=UPI00137A0143|nr:glycosyltransferase family 2 protein [Pontibacter russatus]